MKLLWCCCALPRTDAGQEVEKSTCVTAMPAGPSQTATVRLRCQVRSHRTRCLVLVQGIMMLLAAGVLRAGGRAQHHLCSCHLQAELVVIVVRAAHVHVCAGPACVTVRGTCMRRVRPLSRLLTLNSGTQALADSVSNGVLWYAPVVGLLHKHA
jgi:hypothetical protein